MTIEEFRKEMRESGATDEVIDRILQNHENAKKTGITPPPLETYLIDEIINN